MRGKKERRRGGPWAVAALVAFALVLVLSPAQHEDFRPDAVPGHCHACTATPVASLAIGVTPAQCADLPPAGRVTPPSERPHGALAARAATDRAPPSQL